MEKEQKENIQNKNLAKEENDQATQSQDQSDDHKDKKEEEVKKELTPEEKILELEDKLARTFAEMENQRDGLRRRGKMLLNTVVFHLLKKHLAL